MNLKNFRSYLSLLIFYPIFLPPVYCSSIADLEQKAKSGDPDALYSLGILHRINLDNPSSIKKAASYFLRAAKMGHIDAQYEIGIMYFNGEGIAQDHVTAIHWLLKAADNGDSRAQYMMGYIYESLAEYRDYNKSLYYYELAANQNDNAALYRLGFLHENGPENIKDNKKALEYYEIAANKNYVKAQYALGKMYLEGRGVEKNIILAQKWFIIAYREWHHFDSYVCKTKLEQIMSHADLAKAKELAEIWLNKFKESKSPRKD